MAGVEPDSVKTKAADLTFVQNDDPFGFYIAVAGDMAENLYDDGKEIGMLAFIGTSEHRHNKPTLPSGLMRR